MQFLDTKFREGDGAIRGVKGRLGAMPLQPAVVRPPAPIFLPNIVAYSK